MNYNAILKYIIENLSDYREEIESTLSYMYKYRISFQQADRGNKLEDAILSAISDYEVDNDYEEDEILDRILSERDLEDIFFDVVDNLDKHPINENLDEEKVESIEPSLLSAILKRHGWSYFSSSEWVNNTTGKEYIRYVCSKDRKDASDRFEVFFDIRRHASYPQGIKLQTAQYNAAPEIKYMTIEVEVFVPDAKQLDLFDSKQIELNKDDKVLLESLIYKYGKSGVNTAISRLYEEDIETSNYIDDNGNHHMVWYDEDTGEKMDIILDDNDDLQLTPSDDMNFHVDVGDYNYNKSFETLEDALEYIKNGKFAKDKFLYIYDNDYNYYDPETGEIENAKNDFDTISDRIIDLQNELKDYKQRRKLLMSDMENDPDVINDLDGEAAQEYGKQLGEIDEYIEELKDQIQNLSRGKMNEGRLQGYPIPGYKAPYNSRDFDDTDIDLDQIDEREEVIKNELAEIYNSEFPEPGERYRIELTDGWYIILSNCLFEKSDMMGLINVTIGYGKDKEYNYGNGRYYKDIDDMENAIKTVLNRMKNSNWYDPYIYNKIEELKPIKYKDYEFKNTVVL